MKASDVAQPQGRSSDVHREEVIIVGAGQAGLSMGYWLKQKPRSFLLLEAGPRIGESWRQRYDSLVLFTPRRYSALPGLALPGDPEGRPTKDELADYLQGSSFSAFPGNRRVDQHWWDGSAKMPNDSYQCCKPQQQHC